MAVKKNSKRDKTGKLDVRESRAAAFRAQGMPKSKALEKAGYSPATAHSNCTVIFDRIETKVDEALREEGLTPSEFAKDIQALRGAVKTRIEKEDTVIEVPDNQARVQALNIWARVAGYEKPKKHEHDVSGHVSIEQVRKEQSRLAESLNWLE